MTVWVKEIRQDELKPVAMMSAGVWKRYVSADGDGRGMVFGMGCLNPGEEAGHTHVEEELFYVLQGRGEATWESEQGTQRAELKPGTAFYKTSHIYHVMRNTGDEPLVGLFFKV
jgi:oxalate decarboxylase/phosphoglucose isomerase-like protein (cupin superfamily)